MLFSFKRFYWSIYFTCYSRLFQKTNNFSIILLIYFTCYFPRVGMGLGWRLIGMYGLCMSFASGFGLRYVHYVLMGSFADYEFSSRWKLLMIGDSNRVLIMIVDELKKNEWRWGAVAGRRVVTSWSRGSNESSQHSDVWYVPR